MKEKLEQIKAEALRQIEAASQESMSKITGGLGSLGGGLPF